MNKHPIGQAQSAELRGSHAALLRSAQRARELALRTGTWIVVVENGELRRLVPAPLAQEAPARYELR